MPGAWLKEQFEEEFWDQFEEHNKQKGWVLFDPERRRFQSVKTDDEIIEILREKKVPPLYVYKPLNGDDKILIVRNEVVYNCYATHTTQNSVSSFKWSIMTKNQSLSESPPSLSDIPNDIFEIDHNGNRKHKSVYSSVTSEFLCNVIGSEYVHLMKCASVLSGQAEKARPRVLSNEPIFSFADDFNQQTNLFNSVRHGKNPEFFRSSSSVKLSDRRRPRFYDEGDLDKNNKHIMPTANIGVFMFRQIYYYDLRDQNYFVNTKTTQISALKYNPILDKFIGLEKLKGYSVEVTVEKDWIASNFSEKFVELIKLKGERDNTKFVKVPIGKAKPTLSPEEIRCNPRNKFLQNGIDNCVYVSIANALNYMEYDELALKVMKYGETVLQNQALYEETFEKSLNLLHNEIGNMKVRCFNRAFKLTRIRNAPEFDLMYFAKNNPNYLIHVVIVGKDCSQNHCVSIYNGYIFDGNYTNAWILSKKSLSECIDSEFACIQKGYLYVPQKEKS